MANGLRFDSTRPRLYIPVPSSKRPPKEVLRRWRVTLLRQRGQYLGTVEAPDAQAAEAAAVREYKLTDEQRRRLAVRERT